MNQAAKFYLVFYGVMFSRQQPIEVEELYANCNAPYLQEQRMITKRKLTRQDAAPSTEPSSFSRHQGSINILRQKSTKMQRLDTLRALHKQVTFGL